ncbi:cell wall manno protein MnpA [Venturia nashicola]|uniref:Cell wall manno protein MnpA n=1 Tax=Venturia nashicola TaxID=86259 RepID=A0A4Z1NY21_9PEZI|nr:cell wall manno protein MnpA [Venturia nashicola]
MKFSSAITILAASSVASASILERQVQTIIGVVNGINGEVGKLDTAIKGFSGDPKPLLAASQKTLDTVTKGVETVNGASSITLTDSVQIQGQVQNLQSSLEGVISSLGAKKTELVAAGQGQAVYKNLQDQLTGAKGLATAISSKVPPEVKSLADTLSQGIISALQKGVDNFKDAPAGGSAGGASSGASAPSHPTSSESAPAGGAPAAGASGESGQSGSSSSAPSSSGSKGSSSGTPTSGAAGSAGSAPAGGAAGGAAGTGTKPATPTGTNGVKPAKFDGAAPHTAAASFVVIFAAVLAFAAL